MAPTVDKRFNGLRTRQRLLMSHPKGQHEKDYLGDSADRERFDSIRTFWPNQQRRLPQRPQERHVPLPLSKFCSARTRSGGLLQHTQPEEPDGNHARMERV